jgi:cytochrome bd ubiquinol oxidase subunit I
VVQDILRTADAVSPVPAATVATTLALFVVVYLIVFSAGSYFINRLLAKGVPEHLAEPPTAGPRLAAGFGDRPPA